MPLIVMCGIPCSGKTTIAKKIAAMMEQDGGKKVEIINEESLNLVKQAAYKDTNIEKNTRAALRAAVDRALQKDTLVIFDSMNYIKGFRYEIYCVSRAIGTPQCVIHCNTPVEMAREWNKTRSSQDGIDDALYLPRFMDLSQRFETPNPAARWDDPLFVITPGSEIPHAAIRAALYERQAPKPNVATTPQILTDTSYVHELDRTTQEIITHIVTASATALPGDVISLPKTSKKLTLTRKLTIAELQRLKRQFLKLTSLHQPTPQQVADSFAEFLTGNI